MRTFALTLDLKNEPEAIAAYEAYHAQPWPEVLEALREVGIESLRIWRWQTRLFMLYTADEEFEPSRDFARYLTLNPLCQAWEDLMTTYQQPLPGTPEGEKWQMMSQVFDLNL